MQHYQADNYRTNDCVACLLKHASMLMIETLEPTLALKGFTLTQWLAMVYLRDQAGWAPKTSELRHSGGALTRMIDSLETRGLVQRERSLKDRRVVKLCLTDAGMEAVQSQIPMMVDRLNSLLRDFSRTDVADLMRLLTKLIANTKHVGGQPEVVA
jgi:DNA-binding MarR family transcriptional regulator